MKTGLVLAAAAAFTSASSADVGVVEATGAFQLAGASSTSYVSAIGAGQNPRLDGYSFGSVDVGAGQTLLLQNWFFENYGYNGGSTPAGAATNDNWIFWNNSASLAITIKSGGTVVSTVTQSLYMTSKVGNNAFWQMSLGGNSNFNLAYGLSAGSYSVEFTTNFNANQWTGSVSQFDVSTATSTASFTVVPAPGAIALLGVAGLLGTRRRR